MVQAGEVEEVAELESSHEEADTRLFPHAKWSKQQVVQIVAADTDVLAILLLNYHHFSAESDNSKVRTKTKILMSCS